MEREREEKRAEDERAAAILAAEAAEAEEMGLADDEVALDEAEQEMFRHLQDLDSHLGQEDGEHEQAIGSTFTAVSLMLSNLKLKCCTKITEEWRFVI